MVTTSKKKDTTNNAVKTTSKEGMTLMSRLADVKLGDKLQFEGFMDGFGQSTVAHCVEVEAGRFWQFSLFWCGVHIQDVVAEVQDDNLVLEACGT